MDVSIDLMDPENWDDSALIDSWDQALNEYKKYHSIHARGEKIEDVLKQHELEKSRRSTQEGPDPSDSALEKPAISEEVHIEQHDQEAGSAHHPFPGEAASHIQEGSSHATLPLTLLATVADNDLKNLMMSWYYAGYHTGYVEGKRAVLGGPAGETKDS